MNDTQFKISRINGRSDAQVICDLLANREPGEILTYAEIGNALGEGTDRRFDRPTIQGVIARTSLSVGRSIQRALHNIRGVGYRIAPARDHRLLATERKRRADKQLLKGLRVLQNVRWDELEPAAREAHEGQMMVIGAVVQMQRSMDSRLSKIESAIAQRNAVKAG